MRILMLIALGVCATSVLLNKRPTGKTPSAERKLRDYYDSLGADGVMARGMLRGAGYNV